MFNLLDGEKVVDCYKAVFKRPESWNNAFPYSAGYEERTELACFIIVTEDGVLECRPRYQNICFLQM